MRKRLPKAQYGFTLVEAIIVIVITGVLAAGVAVFIRAPVQGYIDSARRAEMTDIADTVVRRISRDLHLALPNSVRISGGNALEMLTTRTGGRYRVELDNVGAGDTLNFAANDTSFDVLGPAVTLAANDRIVVYNLGIGGANAYDGDNIRNYPGGAAALNNITITSAAPFPFDSPGHRFQVVDTPVSYVCDPTARTLRRYSGYTITAAQPPPFLGAGLTNALLAQNVNCTFTYAAGATQRNGLVSVQLTITQSGESVSLHHEVHVNNVP